MAERHNRSLTRRAFSGGMLSAAALLKSAGSNLFAPSTAGQCRYAYVGTPREIHAFELNGGSWQKAQITKAAEPIHLELHPSLPILYAIHRVGRWDGLPRGAVSTYSIDQGLLCHEHTQPLSLSATFPRHGKVSPDGQHLAVAAECGGIYNVLPIGCDGLLGSPTGIFKDVGSTDGLFHKPSQPTFVAWHPDGGTLLTSDVGNGYMSSFEVDMGGFERTSRQQVHQGFRASDLAISQEGKRVYALDANGGSILVQGLDQSSNKVAEEARFFRQKSPGPAVMAACERTRRIVTVGSSANGSVLTIWQMDSSNGWLEKLDQMRIREGQRAVTIAPCGNRLYGVAAVSGEITEWQINLASGRLSAPVQVAWVDGAYFLSMSLKGNA